VDADRKLAALRGQHAAHPIRTPSAMARFDRATRSSTRATSSRSDTKMLRRVRDEGQSVTETASAFGVSRQGFYASASAFAQEGLPGLVPSGRTRRAHKLSDLVVDALRSRQASEPGISSADLARIAGEQFGISVHRRSVERALARRKRGLRQAG